MSEPSMAFFRCRPSSINSIQSPIGEKKTKVVRAFDDAEVIHVEGEVDPLRDMSIIQTELRLKDIEWVEKHLEGLKRTGRSLGSSSLADKARKEEIVRALPSFRLSFF
jgi:ribosome-binding ATPase YchF (GTP1/OBG family)